MPDYNYSYQSEYDDIYCYPKSDVFINAFDIHDKAKLHEVEREIALAKIVKFRTNPIRGLFDLAHLRAIHRFIFGDIYSWAGELRQYDFLAKQNTIFCRGSYLDEYAKKIHQELESERYLKYLEKPDFIARLAYYMGEINALHPFREGNGRTQREYFYLLAGEAGYILDWTGIDKEALLDADVAAFNAVYEPLIVLLNQAVSPKN